MVAKGYFAHSHNNGAKIHYGKRQPVFDGATEVMIVVILVSSELERLICFKTFGWDQVVKARVHWHTVMLLITFEKSCFHVLEGFHFNDSFQNLTDYRGWTNIRNKMIESISIPS